MKKLAIIGGGSFGQQIAHHAEQTGHFKPVFFFDDTIPPGTSTNKLPVRGNCEQIESSYADAEFDEFVIGIGYHHFEARHSLFSKLAASIPAATIIHPSCFISPSAKIGPGTVIMPGVTIDSHCDIGRSCVINCGTVISHDCKIHNNVFIGPGATLAGNVEVSSHCFIGVGTTLIDNLVISEGIQTGGGAVVTKDISTPGLYAGVPASFIRPVN